MNKTQLRARLSTAINGARDLKNVGLNPRYEWHYTHLLRVAEDLRVAADSIEQYVTKGK